MSNKRPVLHARVNGIMYDKKGEMIEVDVLEQGTGVLMFTADDEDNLTGRTYGELSIKDVAGVLYLLRKTQGEREFAMALQISRMVVAKEDMPEGEQPAEEPGEA